jgi:hypothetical protein
MMTHSKLIAFTALCTILIAGSPRTAAAQTDSSSFADALAQLERGTMVAVTDDSGRKIVATIAAVSASSLTAATAEGKVETFSEAHVREVAKRQRNTGKGAKVGFGVGAALGLVLALQQKDTEGQGLALGAAIGLAGIGAGVGAVAGANVLSERTIYRAPGGYQGSAVVVAPIVSKDRAGVSTAIRF